jgi:hypothetical protein
MSLGELRSQRDLAFNKVEKSADKVKKAVDSSNERAVARAAEKLRRCLGGTRRSTSLKLPQQRYL